MKSRRARGFEGVKELSRILDRFGVFARIRSPEEQKTGYPIVLLEGHNEPSWLAERR